MQNKQSVQGEPVFYHPVGRGPQSVSYSARPPCLRAVPRAEVTINVGARLADRRPALLPPRELRLTQPQEGHTTCGSHNGRPLRASRTTVGHSVRPAQQSATACVRTQHRQQQGRFVSCSQGGPGPLKGSLLSLQTPFLTVL